MPGAGKQSAEVQEHIKELLEAGFDPTTIHRRLKVGRSSIYRMKRCLQQHGTAYMPPELNKKNGRPKVLTAEQELEVRDWLANPQNRTRYLDDLVWLIHDRFNIVCSTTTMSKLKRKWLHAIECEETGAPLDDTIRAQLMETHPNLPILHRQPAPASAAPTAQMGLPLQQHQPGQQHSIPSAMLSESHLQMQQHAQHANEINDNIGLDPDIASLQQDHQLNQHMDPSLSSAGLLQHQQQYGDDQKAHMDFNSDQQQYQQHPHATQADVHLHQQLQEHHQQQQQQQQQQMTDPLLEQQTTQLDERLEQQLQREIASA